MGARTRRGWTVADHGTDVDPRAEAALEALRQGRPAPDVVPNRWWEPVRGLVEAMGWSPVRIAAVGAGVVAAVVLVGTLALVALRPAGQVGDTGTVSPFAASAATTVPPSAGSGSSSTTLAQLVVHAAGAVQTPGVYRLAPGARVADLLEAAGGPTADTDLDRLNLAAPLADGQRLYVPRTGEDTPVVVAPEGGGGSSGAGRGGTDGATGAAAGPIDLNQATVEQLDTLPGVGPATAGAIVDHRERNGPFASVDGLLDVRGIGPAKLEALRDLVTVG